MKKVIRLTEGDIHRIVKNSVKKVLTELDWKTYQNAAKKAHLRGVDDYGEQYGGNPNLDKDKQSKYFGMAKNFSQAAEDAFDRDYGFDDGRFYTKMNSQRYGGESQAPGGGYFPYQDVSKVNLADRRKKTVDGYDREYEDWAVGDDFLSRSEFGDDVVDKYNKANTELSDYKRNNYDYQKGKGWKLKK